MSETEGKRRRKQRDEISRDSTESVPTVTRLTPGFMARNFRTKISLRSDLRVRRKAGPLAFRGEAVAQFAAMRRQSADTDAPPDLGQAESFAGRRCSGGARNLSIPKHGIVR